MNTILRSIRVAFGAGALLGLGAPAAAQEPSHQILLSDLSVREAEVVGLVPGAVRVQTTEDVGDSIGLERVAGLWRRDAHAFPTVRSPGMLELVDGQRWSGELGAGAADTIAWTHPILGRREVSLEAMVRWTRNGAGARSPETGLIDDVVVLANGDRIEGFVVEIGESVTVDAGDPGDEPITLPLNAITSITLANERTRLEGPVLWLHDESVVRIDGFGANGGEEAISVRLRGRPGGSATIPLARVLGFTPEAERLLPLHTLDLVVQTTPEGRGWSEPATFEPAAGVLGARALEIPSPMTLRWRLPGGARRFGTEVSLPRGMWLWGDCELEVAAIRGGARMELARVRLNADTPQHVIAVELPSNGDPTSEATLELRLSEGRYGPIQDRIVVSRPMILLD